MKLFTLTLVTLFAFVAQAGGAKRDGFLKKTSDVALVLETETTGQTCFNLAGKQKVLGGILLSPPTMTINKTATPTKMLSVDTQVSNHKYVVSGTDVAGEAFKIEDKKIAQLHFCADISKVEIAGTYLLELEIPGGKKGSVEVLNLD